MNPDRKKIIYITVRSDYGGGPYHIDLLVKNLSAFFDFYIASPLNKPYGFQWQEQFGINKFFGLPFRSFNIISFFKLISFIKKNSIGIIHSHGKGAGFYGRLIRILIPKVKVIHTFHGFHIQEYNILTKKVYIFLEKILSILTDLFINVSIGERQICLTNKIYNEKKSVVIYNAVSNPNPPVSDKKGIRNSLSLPEDKFIVISVTRFNFQKNLHLIISIAELLMTHERFLFLIIGDGEQKNRIETMIASKNILNVKLLSAKNNINEYLTASDVYLSTSLWEGLPYSLIEASAVGLPIVASNVTGNNEVVTEGVNGNLFELNRTDEAIKILLEFEHSPEKLKTMGENSIKLFKEKFQLDIMIEKMKEVYNNFAER